jgi:hypothetical protein
MKWLIPFLFLFTLVNAEEITTGNLITNGNFETGNANNWTTSGDVQVLNDCCELNGVSSNYDLEFGDSGSIQQDFNLSTNTITQNMLDNGITLDSSIDAQNGECNVAGCWGGQGNADTFTNVLTIKDSDGNTLASNTTIRTDVTGIDGAIFTDRLIYNGTGSNVGNINISGSDANAPANLGGPNVDNISVTMTYDTTVLSNEITDEINEIFEEMFEELSFERLEQTFKEEFKFEEEFTFQLLEEPMEEPKLEFKSMVMMVEEIEEEFFEEEIVMEIKEEAIGKEPMATSMFANMPEEEIIEETNELISSFLPPPPKEEPAMEEEITKEEPTMEREEIIEEEPKEMASAPKEEREEIIEESTTEEESKEMAQPNNEQKEKIKEKKSTSKVAKKSAVQSKKLTKQKIIQQKKTIRDNLVKVMDKVDKDIKDISKNLQIKNIIKLDAMTSEQASLDSYDIPFYKSENIYMNQIQIQDTRQLYTDVSLNNYIANDPVVIMENKLKDIETKKQLLIIELEQLKNG